jgi:hypothetical protein
MGEDRRELNNYKGKGNVYAVPSRGVASAQDLEIAKDYVTGVYTTITRVLGEDHQALKARAIAKYGAEMAGPSQAYSSTVKSTNVQTRSSTARSRSSRGVDIWAVSHCRTELAYAEWDVGPR